MGQWPRGPTTNAAVSAHEETSVGTFVFGGQYVHQGCERGPVVEGSVRASLDGGGHGGPEFHEHPLNLSVPERRDVLGEIVDELGAPELADEEQITGYLAV